MQRLPAETCRYWFAASCVAPLAASHSKSPFAARIALLKADKEMRAALSETELEELFDLGYHFRHVDTIFARVFS